MNKFETFLMNASRSCLLMDSFYWKHLMCATISMGSMGDGGLIMTLYDGTMEAIERIFLNFHSSSQKNCFQIVH